MTTTSTFMGLQTALRGILAQQRALDTTAHNLANANTVGYTRQEARFAPALPFTEPSVSRPPQAGQIGTGVDVTEFRRIRDDFIDVQLRAQTMRKGYAEARRDGLSQVELTLNEPSDSGLQSLLSRYWATWQDVANTPEDLATRQALLQNGASLGDGFRTLTSQLATIVSQTGQNASLTVDEINSISSDLRNLNESIGRSLVVGDQPNDLFDQRDLLLDRLGELGAVVTGDVDTDGALTVTLNGVTLVDDLTAYTVSETAGNLENLALAESVSLAGKTGKLASLVELRDTTIPAYQTQLDTIATELIAQTNALHAAGFDLNGAAGGTFFTGTGASDIDVSAALIAAPALVAASGNGQPGNAGGALALGALRTTALAGLGGATIDDAYTQLVTTIGSDAREAMRGLDNASILSDGLENRRQSVSGVSLDEEMASLVRYQRAYQASARALSAMDEMIDVLVNRTGRVGL